MTERAIWQAFECLEPQCLEMLLVFDVRSTYPLPELSCPVCGSRCEAALSWEANEDGYGSRGNPNILRRIDTACKDAAVLAEEVRSLHTSVASAGINSELEAEIERLRADRSGLMAQNQTQRMADKNDPRFWEALAGQGLERERAEKAEADRDELRMEIDRWQEESGLSNSHGDPEGVTPDDLARHLKYLSKCEADLGAREISHRQYELACEELREERDAMRAVAEELAICGELVKVAHPEWPLPRLYKACEAYRALDEDAAS